MLLSIAVSLLRKATRYRFIVHVVFKTAGRRLQGSPIYCLHANDYSGNKNGRSFPEMDESINYYSKKVAV